MRPCHCNRFRSGQPFELGRDCRLCWLAANDPGYQELWGKAEGNGGCQHLGGETGDLQECGSCSGRVRIKLFRCEVHDRCTISKKLDGVACCGGCPDKSPPQEEVPHQLHQPGVPHQDRVPDNDRSLLAGGDLTGVAHLGIYAFHPADAVPNIPAGEQGVQLPGGAGNVGDEVNPRGGIVDVQAAVAEGGGDLFMC